jgi:hypothetical protein
MNYLTPLDYLYVQEQKNFKTILITCTQVMIILKMETASTKTEKY